MIDFTEQQLERYSRHILLQDVGVEGQIKLCEARVLIIGAGGLGAPVAGMLGTIQATEALKFITGAGELLTDTLLSFDARTMYFRKVRLKKQQNCPICGAHPSITELTDAPQAVCGLSN